MAVITLKTEKMEIRIYLQHFVCNVCEKPFLGHRHYERKGLAYCEGHYHMVGFCEIYSQKISRINTAEGNAIIRRDTIATIAGVRSKSQLNKC